METALTHWIPPFTRHRADGYQEAICGRFIPWAQHAPDDTLPTCPKCTAYLTDMDAEPTTAPLGRIA